MSVPAGQRKDSGMEFLRIARDIEIIFIDMRIKKPKRYTFFFDRLLDICFDLLNNVKGGNSIYPENQEDAQLRAEYFKRGLANCQMLVSQLEVVRYKLGDEGIPINQIQEVALLLTTEIKLLKGILANDRKRYKNLPQRVITQEED